MAGGLVFEKTKSSFQLRVSGVWADCDPARSSQTSSVQLPKAFSPMKGLSVSSGRKYASRPALRAVTCTISIKAPLVVKERNSSEVAGVRAWKVKTLVRQPAALTVKLVATKPLVRTRTTAGFVGYPGGGRAETKTVGSLAVRKLTTYCPLAVVLKLVMMPPGTQFVMLPSESQPP